MKFKVVFNVSVDIEISDKLLRSVLTPEFRASHYNFLVPEDVAEHIAYNFSRNRASLLNMDGFADQPADAATLLSEDWNREEVVVMTAKKKTKKRKSK